MRATIPAVLAAALWLAAAADARAAPTCQDLTGQAVKCGTPGAMPVGWTAPPAAQWERDRALSPEPDTAEQWALVLVIGGLFALIALMPKFDGWTPGDWDHQEGDEEE